MSNPTTPFSWQMPTATDLVTDLPADFEVFGQAVATSMADLLGGASGYILSKNSATDMDFTWIPNDQGDITGITAGTGITVTSPTGPVPTVTNAMATEIAAKGDLIVGTGAATFDNLTAGNNGETLVADSAATTGLRYSATPSASNPVLNSAYQVWQRGTSVAGAGGGAYTADRWFLYAGGQITVSRQVTGDTTNLPNIQYCARVQRANASTDATAFVFGQSSESVNSIPFAGKTVTLSFYARKGANYSPTSSLLNVFLYTGTGTDQNQPTGYTGQASPISSSATLTTTWQRFTFTGTVAATATEISTQFYMVPVGTAGAADYYEVTGVQIDVGSVALPFRTYAATIQGELAACQRYFCKLAGVSAYGGLGAGFLDSATAAKCFAVFPVEMRTTPSATSVGSAWLAQLHGSATFNSMSNPTKNGAEMIFTISGGTTGRGTIISSNNDATVFMTYSAEL